MALKRKFDNTGEGEECVEWSSSLFSKNRLSAIDDVARISWRCPTQSSIQQLLQGDPATVSVIEQLGLVQTFSIPYCIPKIHAVKEFAHGFNSDSNSCDFRGRNLEFTTAVLREAFLLPGKFSPFKDYSWYDTKLTTMFPEHEPKTPYTVRGLKGDYEKWVKPILDFQELVLGKQWPNQIIRKHMWYFFSYLSDKVEPSGRPDLAELVQGDLKREIVKLKKHLGRSEEELRNPLWSTKTFSCNCGTAVTRILMHFGFSEEELSRNMLEKVKIEQSPVVTRMTDVGVERISTQVDTAEPSATQLERKKENANEMQRSVGGEPIAGSAGGVPLASYRVGKLRKESDNAKKEKRSEGGASPTSSMRMLDLELSQADQGATEDDEMDGNDVDGDLRCAQSSFQEQRRNDIWQTLEDNLRTARIQVKSRTTERDNKLAALLLEKDNIENKLSMVKGELTQQKMKFDIELAAALREKNEVSRRSRLTENILHKRDALLKQAIKDKQKLLRIHETIQRHLEEEKEKNLCQICLEAQRDTISFPCLHLHYCFTCLHEHSKRSNTCPTCRMPISGVLKANIWT